MQHMELQDEGIEEIFREVQATLALDLIFKPSIPEACWLKLVGIVRDMQGRQPGVRSHRRQAGLLLDTRWANLRGRLSWLEFCLGVHSNQADPALWTVLETGVRRENFSVHTLISHQWETARLRLMATATLRTGQVMSGLFVGSQDRVKHTFGLIGMGTF